MSVYGYLHTMALPDLLQWASLNRKSGVLEVERGKICKRIVFRDGRIVGCSSDDPSSRLGQVLISRGLITEPQLREALSRQETSGNDLGTIFRNTGALTREQIASVLETKAEDIIYGMFDWSDALFRFRAEAVRDPYLIEVDLSVQDVLLKGVQRWDELQQIRETFPSSGIVLERTGKRTPSEVRGNTLATRILDSVDGERSLAEILIRARAAEFLVVKFLFTLLRKGVVGVRTHRPPVPGANTILDTVSLEGDHPDTVSPDGRPDPVAASGEALARDREIDSAMRLMADGEHGRAFEILNACYRANPGDNHVRQMLLKAEAGYLAAVRNGRLRPSRIPVVRPGVDPATTDLPPQELFLLSLLDGKSDIRSLVWIAPLREVDLLLALEHLLAAGLIQLRDAGDAPTRDAENAPSVQWSPV